MFIDEVKIKVISWKWWDWLVSWRREKYIPKWWPWGWDGWKWWDVYLQTDCNLNTLSFYRNRKELWAEKWERWLPNCKHWANWEDLILKVPPWTLVKDLDTWEIIVDLDKENTKFLIAEWWRWWYWNAHFVSSTRQAPSFAELWDVAQEKNIFLELKLVADIWIIWIPSAWKSSLISKITNVTPKIWDYPFTTIIPNLWLLDHKGKSLVIEDVPWLIPWASEWKWLWVEFLKHIERTGVLLHMLDLYRLDNIFKDYSDLRKELSFFSDELSNKKEIIIFSKSDLLDKEMKEFIIWEFLKKFKVEKYFIISSATWEWIEELKDYLIENIKEKNFEKEEINSFDEQDFKSYDLRKVDDYKKIDINYIWDYTFEVFWDRLEQIIRMTDFSNKEAVIRVYDVLDKMWVLKKIESKLKKIVEENEINNDFFFEWNDDESFAPRLIISWREIELKNLKYNF